MRGSACFRQEIPGLNAVSGRNRVLQQPLAKIGSRDQWPQYPSTMIWLILTGLFLAAVVLALLARNQGLTPAVGGLIVLVPSFWTSVQSGLPEPIATATLLGGILSLSCGRWVVAALCFAISLLVRETGIIANWLLCDSVADWRPPARRSHRWRLFSVYIDPLASVCSMGLVS